MNHINIGVSMIKHIKKILKLFLIFLLLMPTHTVAMHSNNVSLNNNNSNHKNKKVVDLVKITPYPIIASTSCLRYNYPTIKQKDIHKNNALAYINSGELISFKVKKMPLIGIANKLAITSPSLNPGPMPKIYGGSNPYEHLVFTELLYKEKLPENKFDKNRTLDSNVLRVAVLISDHSQCVFGRDYLPLINAFQKNGLSYEEVVWNSSKVNWKQYDAVILRSTVDYFENPQIYSYFMETITKIEEYKIPLFNNAQTIRWNSTKEYLKDLEAKGILIPETKWIKGNEIKEVLANLPEDWNDIVIKPIISTGGFKTFRLKNHQEIKKFNGADFDPNEGIMVQKTVPEIFREGEWSFVFFNGEYSHTTLKTAAPGEFKVQSFRGGQMSNILPETWMIDEAKRILTTTNQGNLLYARVDVIRRDHSLVVMEIELIEPDLYWSLNPKAPELFATYLRKNIEDAKKLIQ